MSRKETFCRKEQMGEKGQKGAEAGGRTRKEEEGRGREGRRGEEGPAALGGLPGPLHSLCSTWPIVPFSDALGGGGHSENKVADLFLSWTGGSEAAGGRVP